MLFITKGTRLEKRLKRGDRGINPLDAACKQHDIAYAESKSLDDRTIADKILQKAAFNRTLAKESNTW